MIRIADMLPARPDRRWDLAHQMGVRHAIVKLHPDLTGASPPSDIDTLRASQAAFSARGLHLAGLEGDQMDMSRIKQGLPGRDADIEAYQRMIRNMGQLGIRLLCYNWMVGMNWGRTAVDKPIRGGAWSTEYDHALVRDAAPIEGVGRLTQEQVWDNYTYFIERVAPLAAECGVQMGLHPDDPPVPEMRGVGRIFATAGAFDRAMSLFDGPSHGITFCQATFGLMPDCGQAGVAPLARRWAHRMPFIHWRDVAGTSEHFHETFHDDGPSDMRGLLKVYADAGVDAYIRVDHVPAMAGEQQFDAGLAGKNTMAAGYETMGRLFAIGYLKGLLEGQDIEFE